MGTISATLVEESKHKFTIERRLYADILNVNYTIAERNKANIDRYFALIKWNEGS